jgi:class 3 adenylate cyclase
VPGILRRVIAARISAQAQGGEILVAGLLHDLVAPSGAFTFDEGREVGLKGLTGTYRVFKAERGAA